MNLGYVAGQYEKDREWPLLVEGEDPVSDFHIHTYSIQLHPLIQSRGASS